MEVHDSQESVLPSTGKAVGATYHESLMCMITFVLTQEGNGYAQLRDSSYIRHSFVEAVTLQSGTA